MDYHKLREDRVRALILKDFHDSYTEFAGCVDIAESTISRWFSKKNHKNIGEKSARHIETVLKLGDHALDKPEGQSVGLPVKKSRSSDPWPFDSIDYERFDNLSPKQQGVIEGRVSALIEEFEAATKEAIKRISHQRKKSAA